MVDVGGAGRFRQGPNISLRGQTVSQTPRQIGGLAEPLSREFQGDRRLSPVPDFEAPKDSEGIARGWQRAA